jgi:hypothetical protein
LGKGFVERYFNAFGEVVIVGTTVIVAIGAGIVRVYVFIWLRLLEG